LFHPVVKEGVEMKHTGHRQVIFQSPFRKKTREGKNVLFHHAKWLKTRLCLKISHLRTRTSRSETRACLTPAKIPEIRKGI
jgi:hypothetical protein